MANFKLTISDKKGKSLTKELKDNEANSLLGLQIGKEADAAIVGLAGKMKITGGSDKSGVPMRADLHGGSRKYVLLSKGVGLQDAEKGQRVRKLTRGNTISEEIYQVNCKFDGVIPAEKPKSPKEDKKKEKTDSPKEKPKSPKEDKKKEKTDSPKEKPKPPKEDKKKEKTDSPKKAEKPEKKE